MNKNELFETCIKYIGSIFMTFHGHRKIIKTNQGYVTFSRFPIGFMHLLVHTYIFPRIFLCFYYFRVNCTPSNALCYVYICWCQATAAGDATRPQQTSLDSRSSLVQNKSVVAKGRHFSCDRVGTSSEANRVVMDVATNISAGLRAGRDLHLNCV